MRAPTAHMAVNKLPGPRLRGVVDTKIGDENTSLLGRRDSVRTRYLGRLGYTPLLFQGGASPTLRQMGRRSSYNPNMTPPVGRPPTPTSPPPVDGYGGLESGFEDGKRATLDSARKMSVVEGIFASGGTASSVFNLLGATVGAGALALPYAMRLCGVTLGAALLVFAAICCVYTIRLLIKCRQKARLCSYEDLALHCFGRRASQFVQANILIFCFGTCIAYLIAVADIIVPIGARLEHRFPDYCPSFISSKPGVVGVLGAALVFPLSMAESTAELRYANLFGTVIFSALVIGVCIDALGSLDPRSPPVHALAGPSLFGILAGIPMMLYSFTCHINVFSIFTELHRPSIRKMDKVCIRSCSIALVLYILLAVVGFWRYGQTTRQDILLNVGYTHPVLATMQLLMAVNIILSFPMNVYPARMQIEMLFLGDCNPSPLRHMALTAAWVGMAMLCAVSVPHISTVFGVLGATTSVMVSFVLPAGFYLSLHPPQSPDSSVVHRVLASALFYGGLLLGVLATTVSVLSIAHPEWLDDGV